MRVGCVHTNDKAVNCTVVASHVVSVQLCVAHRGWVACSACVQLRSSQDLLWLVLMPVLRDTTAAGACDQPGL